MLTRPSLGLSPLLVKEFQHQSGTTSYSATAAARLVDNVAREDARAARSV